MNNSDKQNRMPEDELPEQVWRILCEETERRNRDYREGEPVLDPFEDEEYPFGEDVEQIYIEWLKNAFKDGGNDNVKN